MHLAVENFCKLEVFSEITYSQSEFQSVVACQVSGFQMHYRQVQHT